MTEKLLQYIWQFQYFNRSSLQTIEGESLEIINPGKINTGQGPDFTDALVKVNDTILAGSVELHIKTSQWNDHGHQHDANYRNVVLHVVYENNEPISPTIPLLELQSRISNILLERYINLMNAPTFIACSGSISQVKDLTWVKWKERLLAERLTRKSGLVFSFLEQNQLHWEEAFWWMLARNFGTNTNAEAFEAMARSIPVNLLAKHKSQIHQLEALLIGQAGLLNHEFNEAYPKLLQREYVFLRKKYQLVPITVPFHFLRMRPGNFPTIRLAQLAALIHNSSHLFARILETIELGELRDVFNVSANDYWHYHYRFVELSAIRIKNTGKEMCNNILINTVIPVLFAYGCYHKEEKYKMKAIQWLEETEAESNAITRGFTQLKIENRSAFDSQSLIELKTQYCDPRHCLKCSIGNTILNL